MPEQSRSHPRPQTPQEVPRALRDMRRWVAWRWTIRDGKDDKPPINVHTGEMAQSDVSDTWADLGTAMAYAQQHDIGIGFVFEDKDGLAGIDLDKCRDAESGEIAPWALGIIQDLETYTEVSPSGTGVKLWVKGNLPKGGRRRGNIEMYEDGRYFTVTGDHLEGTPAEPQPRQEAVDALHQRVFGDARAESTTPKTKEPVHLGDAELLDKMRNAANGADIDHLWDGDDSMNGGDASAADLAMCNHLAFWTGRDPERMDRMFRASQRFRDKWDRVHYSSGETYGAHTIAKAIASCDEVYTPGVERDNGNGTTGHNDLTEPAYLADAPDVTELTEGANEIPAMGEHVRVASKLWTGADLLSTVFPDPVWVVPNLLPSGLAILAGRPKLGKSFLALQLAIALDSGGRFMDTKLEAGGVVYLALEDSPRRLKTRLVDMMAPAGCGVRFFFEWQALNGPGLNQLVAEMRRDPPKLVIIDTLSRAVGGRVDWDDIGSVTGIMGKMQGVAKDHDATVLFVDHHRKGGAEGFDVIDDVLGSTGKTGVADTIWGLYRERGKKGATLRATGRDIEEQDMSLLFDVNTLCWQRTEDDQGVKRDTLGAKILDMIRKAGNMTTKEIAAALGLDAAQVSRELAELCDEHHALERLDWEGRRGVPYIIAGTSPQGEIDINGNNPVNPINSINPTNRGIDRIDRLCALCGRSSTHTLDGVGYCARCAP